MSAECVGWVYRYSPARGAKMLVHLAIADSANDQYGYELWMRQAWLADKARVSRRAARDALQWLTDQGLLLLVEPGKTLGKPNRYRFLMPDTVPTWTPHGGQPVPTGVAPSGLPGGQPVPAGVGTQVPHNSSNNSTQPKTTTNARPSSPIALQGFDEFWAAYPRKQAKGAARKAWPAAVKAAALQLHGQPAYEVITAGATAYANSPDRTAEFTAHPATWLRAERWTDEPQPRGDRRGVVAPTTSRPTQGAVFDL